MKDYKLTKKQKEFFVHLKKYLTDMKGGYSGDYILSEIHTVKYNVVYLRIENLFTIIRKVEGTETYDEFEQRVLTELRRKFIQRTEDMNGIKVGDIVKVLSVERTSSNFDYLDKQMYGVGDEFRVSAVKSSHIREKGDLVEDEHMYSYSIGDLIKI